MTPANLNLFPTPAVVVSISIRFSSVDRTQVRTIGRVIGDIELAVRVKPNFAEFGRHISTSRRTCRKCLWHPPQWFRVYRRTKGTRAQ